MSVSSILLLILTLPLVFLGRYYYDRTYPELNLVGATRDLAKRADQLVRTRETGLWADSTENNLMFEVEEVAQQLESIRDRVFLTRDPTTQDAVDAILGSLADRLREEKLRILGRETGAAHDAAELASKTLIAVATRDIVLMSELSRHSSASFRRGQRRSSSTVLAVVLGLFLLLAGGLVVFVALDQAEVAAAFATAVAGLFVTLLLEQRRLRRSGYGEIRSPVVEENLPTLRPDTEAAHLPTSTFRRGTSHGSILARLEAEGRLTKASGTVRDLPPPLPATEDGGPTLTDALLEMRDEER